MAVKPTYVNGSYLTPSTLNGYFGTTAATGHVHSGVNDSSSAPKVNLTNAAHVTGLLPLANIAYQEGTFTCTFPVGQFQGGERTEECHYRLTPPVTAGNPSVAQISFPYVKANSISVAYGDSGNPVPASMRPAGEIVHPISVYNGSSIQAGFVRVNAVGSVNFSVMEVDGTACRESLDFLASGQKGHPEFTITYPVY